MRPPSRSSRSSRSARAGTLAAEFRTILSKARRRLREHGGRHDLTPSQVSVVLRLEKGRSCHRVELGPRRGDAPAVDERHRGLLAGSEAGAWHAPIPATAGKP